MEQLSIGGRRAVFLRMLLYSHHLYLHYLTSVQQLSEQRKQQEHEAEGELEPLTILKGTGHLS